MYEKSKTRTRVQIYTLKQLSGEWGAQRVAKQLHNLKNTHLNWGATSITNQHL